MSELAQRSFEISAEELYLLAAIVVVGAVLRGYWMLDPNASYLVDEVYYVPASLHYLNPLSTSIPSLTSLFTENRYVYYYINPEHPPLAKLFMALSVSIFGNNPLGWRFFSTFLGSLTVPVVFVAAKRVAPQMALAAAALFALYPMDIAMSQIGMLDVTMSFFMACAFASMIYDREKLSAIFVGLAIAAKLPGLAVGLAFVYYVLVKARNRGGLNGLKYIFEMLAISLIVFGLTYVPLGVYFGWEAPVLDWAYMILVQQYYGGPTGVLTVLSWFFTFSTGFNPTIFLNNPAFTLLSLFGFGYALTDMKNQNYFLTVGFYVGSMGMLLGPAVFRPAYSFYLENSSVAFTMTDAIILNVLVTSKRRGLKWLGYGLLFTSFAVSAIVLSVYLYPNSAPFTKEIINFRL